MASAQVAAVGAAAKIPGSLEERVIHMAQSAEPRKVAGYRGFVVSPQELQDLVEQVKPSMCRIMKDDDGTLYAGVLIYGANWPLNLYSYLLCCETRKLPFGDLDRIWKSRTTKREVNLKGETNAV
jgi:hypothetical protein